ncbi:hypothetical protein JOC54_001963 [Alkalihalobacillus xiaoxiensis]|uniref:DUF1206 domain-containing protein n=1 Tax=Shouchella xiaoxiensis TaxID=766895 RepID=A0ABS2SW65_9BACI|nr:DUF1206 domain-containing protein [Shouchella xiaoxiensis]MBM7838704.1 hypothetical protein [Shouchella xiaoxiensis]
MAVKKQSIKSSMVTFTRFGFISQGFVFLLMGGLALMVAFGINEDTEDMNGALQSLGQIPFGQLLLWLIGFGLIAFILLMIMKSIKDTGNAGKDKLGLMKRIGYLGIAAMYISIAANAFRFAMNSDQMGDSPETWSATLLSQPFGQWIVGIGGLAIIGGGIGQIVIGFKRSFMQLFDLHRMSVKEKKLTRSIGTFGHVARGIVFLLMGYFVCITAWQQDPDETVGFDGALAIILQQPYGSFALSIVAIGLASYGLFAIVRSKYETISLK